ncbi:MAG: DHHA1 domain-containing protein [Anaerolineae bacterium]
MTLRLYYHDATLREFTARVVERSTVSRDDGTEAPAVRLDQTAFYPTSGGQPHDMGTLAGIPVVEVQEDEAGEIWHLLTAPLSSEQEVVRGQIDWERRFDHMQQHTGQHLLSAAFQDMVSAATVGFHLGSNASTIDLAISDLDWEMVFAVEQAVNAVIWQNRPVVIRIVDESEIADVPLRKPPAVSGKIRVVWVEGFDASACGGTHVGATGEIGLVKVTGLERYKGGVRVSFLCGKRALDDYQRVLNLLQVSSAALSVGTDELPEAIARLEEEIRTLRHDLRQVRAELLDYETERLWQQAPTVDGKHVIVAYWEDHAFADARSVAAQLRERPATVVLMAVTEDAGVRVVCAVSDDLPEPDARTLLRDALAALDGRGGGTPKLAQGGAAGQAVDDVSAVLSDALARHNLST